MAEQSGFRVTGYNGTVEFDGESVTIHRDNLRGKLGHGSAPKRARVSDIIRVDLEQPSFASKGYIRFAVPGEIDNNAVNDHYSVIFTKKQASEFAAVAEAVREKFKTRTDAERLVLRERASAAARQDARASAPDPPAEARYGGHVATGDVYIYTPTSGQATAHKTLSGATATFETGADRSRPTLTRIGAGAIIAGPVGAVVGGLFKKDTSKGYVTVVFADGDTAILEGPSKDEPKMRQFAADVNRLAAN